MISSSASRLYWISIEILIFQSKKWAYYTTKQQLFQEVKEIQNDDETIYEVRLLYLGKYLKEIKKTKNLIEIAVG